MLIHETRTLSVTHLSPKHCSVIWQLFHLFLYYVCEFLNIIAHTSK